MISIEKTYYSKEHPVVHIHLYASDGHDLSGIVKITLTKSVNGADYDYTVTSVPTVPASSESVVLSINYEENLSPDFEFEEGDQLGIFDPTGITKIAIEFAAGLESTSLVAHPDEFYDIKAKMMSVNCDHSNISKMSKKLATFSFLETMMNSAIEYNYFDDANLFYSEMKRLAKFGHSNIDQRNPNCTY